MRVSIVGLGYVGLPLALLSSKKGFDVTGIDLDSAKNHKINNNIDPLSDEYVAENIGTSTLVASDEYESISDSEIVIICVPTPVKENYEPDLGPLKTAISSVAQHLAKGTVVIIESTVNPGVCDEIVRPLLEEMSGLKINEDFYISHCPERINPGDKTWTVENIPRVVGSSNDEGLRRTLEFYNTIIGAPIKPMGNIKEAEACKVVENSFRDINIAFVNELAMSFTQLGINVKNVIDGAATKPFAFMPHYPSIGVGGHCIPVDPYYLIEYARKSGFDHDFLSLARSINNNMPNFTADQLEAGLQTAGLQIKGARVALLGLSYKPDVADDRESPSYVVKEILESRGALVKTYDPFFIEKSDVSTMDEALSDVDAILLAVDHQEFLQHNFEGTNAKVFIDGKNAFDGEKLSQLFIYRGVGV